MDRPRRVRQALQFVVQALSKVVAVVYVCQLRFQQQYRSLLHRTSWALDAEREHAPPMEVEFHLAGAAATTATTVAAVHRLVVDVLPSLHPQTPEQQC